MGIRALFLQPFKIPTGSMQPTLYGIHFVEAASNAPARVPWWKRVLDYVNYSRRHAHATVVEDGHLDQMRTRYPLAAVNRFLFPYTEVRIGRHVYQLPGEQQTVIRYLRNYREKHYPDQPYFEAGETLAHGYHQLGDHLFVDRVRYHFVEPKRGDITVFVTDGIRRRDGGSLRGRYYIKRLVGLPGDELKISERQLYVKPRGETQFVRVDGRVHPAFDRIYSYRGGNRGYSNPSHPAAQYLRSPTDTFTLGDDEYFMLGDNTENSQDSRFWGVVPRRNIVGRASFVYWPFLRRWGLPDRVPAEAFLSQPPSS
jgi:signal peptidase I